MTTANGNIDVDDNTDVIVGKMKHGTDAWVMENCPSVLSLGQSVVNQGCSFSWEAGRSPMLRTPNGHSHKLDVENLVPVLAAAMGASSAGKPSTETIPEEHKLTHFPKLAGCPICQQSKMQRKPCRKATKDDDTLKAEEGKVPKKFGDLITADHIILTNPDEESIHGDKTALVMQDCATSYIMGYPRSRKETSDCLPAMQNFVGAHDSVKQITRTVQKSWRQPPIKWNGDMTSLPPAGRKLTVLQNEPFAVPLRALDVH